MILEKIIMSLMFVSFLFSSCEKQESKSFELIWGFEYTKPAEALSLANTNPDVSENGVLISPDEQLTYLNIKNGNIIWQFNIPNNPYISTEEFLIDSNTLFLKEDQFHKLYSVDLTTGEENWHIDISPKEFFQHSNDAYDKNYLYVNGASGNIFRFEKSGTLNKEYNLLKYSIKDRARSIRILNNQLIFSQRFRGDECPTNVCGRILSIAKETEEVLWEYRTNNGGFIFEPILLENEIIYAGVTDGSGEFVAINANNGEVIWKTLGIIGQSYTLTDSMVLVNGGVRLYALDKFTGKELWNTGLEFGGGHGQDNIGYLNGYVYHAHSGRLYILKGSTGEIVHTEERSPDGSPFQLLAVGDDKVFIQTFNAIYAYSAWE